MAKVTEYPQITKMKDNDILLVDGPDGTRTILKNNAAKDLGGDIIAVTKSGSKDKVTLNLTDSPVDLATEKDLDEVANALLPIGTASGNPAIATSAKLGTTFKRLNVGIEPVQAGTGDPSPDNVREISGWTGANIRVSPTNSQSGGQTYSIEFPSEAGTVYGGTLDVLSGTLTVTWKMVDMGSLEWGADAGQWLGRFQSGGLKNEIVKSGTFSSGILCSKYKESSNPVSVAPSAAGKTIARFSNGFLYIADYEHAGINGAAFKEYVAGTQLAYMLAEPITYQLTPQQIAVLEGYNAVFADCGPVELAYVKDVKIEEMIAEESDSTASRAFTAGEYVIVRDKLYKVTADVSAGAELVPGTNVEETTVGEELKGIRDNEKRLANNGLLEFVLGSINSGIPQDSNGYARTKYMRYANKGDVLTLKSAYPIYYANIYLYNAENIYSYTDAVTIPTTAAGNTYTYTFTEDCWFMIRATKAATAVTLNEDELYIFNNSFAFTHYINATELIKNASVISNDYEEINEAIENKFNIVIQTDTHISAFTDYLSGTAYNKSDFDSFASVARSINKIKVDAFANLGDIVRGYQQDPDYETRKSIDMIMGVYDEISTNKCFVIGNHDDGCLFYNNDLDDNKSTQHVLFPNEQFNRFIKYGENNKNTKNYYYTDINGIRIITLYQRDFDYSSSIPVIESFKIGTEQIDWFTNTALNTNLPVIVLCHAPLVSSLYATGGTGFADIVTALESFASNGGTVIAVLAGHTHARNADKVNDINHIVFANGYTFFEIVSVDTTNRTITCKVVNSSSLADRSFTY